MISLLVASFLTRSSELRLGETVALELLESCCENGYGNFLPFQLLLALLDPRESACVNGKGSFAILLVIVLSPLDSPFCGNTLEPCKGGNGISLFRDPPCSPA